jgi:ketosteroid isomerase-like protein
VADNDATIQRLYTAFAERDGDTMAGCYAPEATFTDPVFVGLANGEPAAMWRMLAERAKDFRLELVEHSASGPTGTARWIAHYTFAQTGRPVVNDVRSTFSFNDAGLIVEQRDVFSFYAWSKQALGLPGLLMGWTPLLQKKVQGTARAGLKQFMSAGR